MYTGNIGGLQRGTTFAQPRTTTKPVITRRDGYKFQFNNYRPNIGGRGGTFVSDVPSASGINQGAINLAAMGRRPNFEIFGHDATQDNSPYWNSQGHAPGYGASTTNPAGIGGMRPYQPQSANDFDPELTTSVQYDNSTGDPGTSTPEASPPFNPTGGDMNTRNGGRPAAHPNVAPVGGDMNSRNGGRPAWQMNQTLGNPGGAAASGAMFAPGYTGPLNADTPPTSPGAPPTAGGSPPPGQSPYTTGDVMFGSGVPGAVGGDAGGFGPGMNPWTDPGAAARQGVDPRLVWGGGQPSDPNNSLARRMAPMFGQQPRMY